MKRLLCMAVMILAALLAAQPASAATYAYDDFGRTDNATAWGTAPAGGAWADFATPCTSSSNKYNLTSGEGRMSVGTGSSRCQQLDVGKTDVEFTGTVKVPTKPIGGSAFGYLGVRATDRDNMYRIRVEFLPDGTTAKCRLQKETTLGGAVQIPTGAVDMSIGDYTTGDRVFLKIRAEGNQIKGACKADSAPTSWAFEATDSSITTGGRVVARATTSGSMTNSFDMAFDDLDASGPTPDEESTFTPVKDSYVASDAASTNYGTSTSLLNDDSPKKHVYLNFAASIPAGATLTAAKLKLYANTVGSGVGATVHRTDDTGWTETGITYNSRPSIWQNKIGQFDPWTSAGTWIETRLDLASVNAMLAYVNGVTLAVKTSSLDERAFDSREATRDPELVLSYIPALPTGDPHPSLAVSGDIGGEGCSPPWYSTCSVQTAPLIDAVDPDAVQTVGDNAYPNGTMANFNSNYDPYYGPFKSITKPAPGNHEYLDDPNLPGTDADAGCYFHYFNGGTGPGDPCLPNSIGSAGDPTKGYYSYDLGNWHLIVLNSSTGCGATAPVACDATSAQYQWLQNDLTGSTATCTGVSWHHPRWTRGGGRPGDTDLTAIWDLLYDKGVDLVFVGHDHNYQRFAPQNKVGVSDPTNGIREFIVGTGGASFHKVPEDQVGQSNLEKAQPLEDSSGNLVGEAANGILAVTLRPTGYNWEFVSEASKTFTDFGTGTCH